MIQKSGLPWTLKKTMLCCVCYLKTCTLRNEYFDAKDIIRLFKEKAMDKTHQ